LKVVPSFLLMLGAHGLIIASGVAWLAPRVGVSMALAVGAVPFIAGTLVKSVLATVTARLVRR
jgi:biotin transport system substrate-specific component